VGARRCRLQRHCIETAKNPVRLFGNFKEADKIQAPTAPAIFAEVFIVKVLSLTSRVLPVLWDLRSDAFILAPAITVPKAGRLALSTIDTALPIGGFQRSQFGYAKAEAMDTL
jgi:hypothetical protein